MITPRGQILVSRIGDATLRVVCSVLCVARLSVVRGVGVGVCVGVCVGVGGGVSR